MHQVMNDKGWLRQHLPTPTPDQLYRFIEGVGKRLDHLEQPTIKQVEAPREAALRDLLGAAA